MVQNMKPILFNTEMVRAILEGRKTVTRRVVKPRFGGSLEVHEDVAGTPRLCEKCGTLCHGLKPPCQPGDVLWVRETWGDYSDSELGGAWYYMYRADYPDGATEAMHPDGTAFDLPKWRPSIHMPREAARLFLRVTDVRVERLNEIDEVGAIDEGAFPFHTRYGLRTAMEDFALTWDSTIQKKDLDRYGWAANPWVWVITFERCEEPEEEQP